METSSTINERWKLCTLAGFIGCILLLVGLRHSYDSVNLSSFQSIAISIASSDDHLSMSDMELSKPSKLLESENPVNQREQKCNIYDGKWVLDPEASPLYHGFQCPFLSDQVSCQKNGRPDTEYEKWDWTARECEIPRFNGTDMLERLRGKRVIVVGDSLNRNQWESLACLLYSIIPRSRAYIDVHRGNYKVFRAKDYNCTVEFYWSPFLVDLNTNQANGQRVLKLDRLPTSALQWLGADIMLFNTGHWWVHSGKFKAWDIFECEGTLVEKMEIEAAFEMAMKTWSLWIDSNVDSTKTTIFFRSISPEHKGKQWCYRETQPIIDESYEPSFPKPVTEIVERTVKAMRTPVKYLNITKLSQYRRDAHPVVYTTKGGKLLIQNQRKQPKSYADCSHWCLPGLPDTWNRLLYASMVLDTSTKKPSSSHLVA